MTSEDKKIHRESFVSMLGPQQQPNTVKKTSSEPDKNLLRNLADVYLVKLEDYLPLTLEQINSYLKFHPLQHSTLGVISSFSLEDGYLVPVKMVAPEHECVVAEIVAEVRNWSKWTGRGGRVTSSQGAYVLKQTQSGPLFLIPDVAYIASSVWQKLTEEQAKTYRGEPFSPELVVEVDKLEGSGSRYREQLRKAELYLLTGTVKVVWLIDPVNKMMIECRKSETGEGIYLSDDRTWRNLSAEDVLPGFVLKYSLLDSAMSKDAPPVEEKKSRVCPDCGQELFCTKGMFKVHFDTH